MLTNKQIAWASQHDWYICLDPATPGAIIVDNQVVPASEMGPVSLRFDDFKALRDWAGLITHILRIMTMDHTPTPWKVYYSGSAVNVRNTNGERICTINTKLVGQEETAAFIVRACNSHEALVELAEAFQSYLQDDSKSPRRKAECLAACDVALKLAKGE